MVMMTQSRENTKNHEIVHIKQVNFIICEYLHKKVLNYLEISISTSQVTKDPEIWYHAVLM